MKGYSISVGMASCGISAGAEEVYSALENMIAQQDQKIILNKTGCIGACFKEVIIEIIDPQDQQHLYEQVTPEKAARIFEAHIQTGQPLQEFILKNPVQDNVPGFFSKQKRIVLENTGLIDPEDIHSYESRQGYTSLKKIFSTVSPEEVRNTIKKSGLRGRGGAGFPTGLKWDFMAREIAEKKYVICNADEGDPGAFMDRSVLEGDPHSVLEGLIIAAYACGADEGYFYVRAEYPLAIHRLEKAISDSLEAGYTGKNILGSGFSFSAKLKIGAGAFVCGEETALIASIEGKRGMPRIRPPYPAQKGLWGYPTVINNVETLATIPRIIKQGSEKFSLTGTEKSKGTKVFALAGKIKRSGLIEVPLGITLKEIIFDIGGGLLNDRPFKAVQLGGPSGGCLPESLLDTPVDYDALSATGAIMGSGGMIVMDDQTCMVDVARFFMDFIRKESCGKCTFCRIGTTRMLEILISITSGQAAIGDLDLLEELAGQVRTASLCGLGQTAPNPVLTSLKYFRKEFEEHILEKKCRALVCRDLLRYTVIPENCTGCTLCARVCPAACISGSKKTVHLIDQSECIQCGRCLEACKFSAIDLKSGASA